MNPNDPAFARTFADRERGERHEALGTYAYGHEGMSTRAYFAAHAPAEPAAWFQPKGLPPRPADPKVPEFPLTAAGRKQAEKFEEAVLKPWRRICDEWTLICAEQRAAQWPWAWADLVLGAPVARETA